MRRILCLLASFVCVAPANAQLTPEILYYSFNEGSGLTTLNAALPGRGNLVSPVVGHTLQAGGGQFNDGHLLGVTNTGASNFVDTGWVTDLGSGDWTVGFYLDTIAAGVNPFMYLFGDPTAGSFRCFTNGAAGLGNSILRGPMTDVIIPGGAGQPQGVVCTWVYDAAAGTISGYLNGQPLASVPQGSLNINGTAAFRVGAYTGTGGTASMLTGTILDEFRFYSRALAASEVSSSWNLPLTNPGSAQYQVNQPGASFDVNAVSGSISAPAMVMVPVNQLAVVSLSSTASGNPWDVVFGLADLVPGNLGGTVFSDGQVLNLASTDPTLGFLLNQFTGPAFVNTLLPILPTVPAGISVQMGVLNPASPIGLSLSQPTRLIIM